MIVRFGIGGGRTIDREGQPGDRLLDIAQAAGLPLEGTCGGEIACATCHLILAPAAFAAVPGPSAEEEDMLDFAEGAHHTSRLSCQVRLPENTTLFEAALPGR